MSTDRASFERLLEFANGVRLAGGGNPIDAVMPAVPEDPSRCLIARNLNFNCKVAGLPYDYEVVLGSDDFDDFDDGAWVMYASQKVTKKVAEKFGLSMIRIPEDCRDHYYASGVVLPEDIGQVAADFDEAQNLIASSRWRTLDEDEKRLVVDMLPYIEESIKEAHNLASIVNPDGSIVI